MYSGMAIDLGLIPKMASAQLVLLFFMWVSKSSSVV